MPGRPILEVPCVVARVEGVIHLVIRVEDLEAAAPGRALMPVGAGGMLVLLTPGGEETDFGWIGGDPGPGEMRAGVAAALAARLHGAVLPEPWLRGGRLGSARCYEFAPARPDWWGGLWTVRPACLEGAGEAPGSGFTARLLLHGEVVLG